MDSIMLKRSAFLVLALALGASITLPTPLAAQQAKVDSLEARIRELEARLDSLLASLGAERADTAARAAAAELEALRAAAQAAASKQPEADTAAKSRTRNLNMLNPEISVTGDVLGTYTAPAGAGNVASAIPREFEFSFQAALDPYTRTKIFVSHEEPIEIAGLAPPEEGPSVEIEEGYVYWVGLPANIGLKAGVFRQQIGLYNRWHTHALLEIDRPLATTAFLGDDGLIQMGASLVLPSLTTGPGTQTLTLEATRGNSETLFDGGNKLSFLANFQSFWDLTRASYLQLGATGVYGENDDENLQTRLLGLDLSFRWRPPNAGLYRDFTLKAEWYFAEKDFGATDIDGNGGYAQANFRVNRRWILGTRFDFLNDFGDGTPDVIQVVPTVTWWQSEWVRLRLQYNYVKPNGVDSSHTVMLQVTWAAGPHKHETY